MIGIATVIYIILGVIASNKGEDFRVPFTFEFLK
ncbi:hypothetical protein NIT62_04220 [Mammaliicoccus sciuri]|nr:DUF4870 domain-containing protein [Mammaliicoccus sciuri]UTI88094.1 hypothetical protein NIT62_04220 [Mammaliicoccus sciuri]